MQPTVSSRESHSPSEFIFRGNVVAAGGFLTKLGEKPVILDPEKVTTHGESSLPLIGGVSRSLVENPELNFPEHIRYGRCETFVTGRRDGATTITTLRASVKQVRLTTSPSADDNVPDVKSISFRAGTLLLEGESVYPQTGQPRFKINPAQPTEMALVVTDKSGQDKILPIHLEFDEHFLSLCTVEEIDKEFLSNRHFFDDFIHRLHSLEGLVFGKSRVPRTPQGYIFGSFVKQIRVGDELIRGNVLTRKGFGRIQFGIVIAGPSGRRFTMAHIKMGSDPGGEADFCAVEDTGIWK